MHLWLSWHPSFLYSWFISDIYFLGRLGSQGSNENVFNFAFDVFFFIYSSAKQNQNVLCSIWFRCESKRKSSSIIQLYIKLGLLRILLINNLVIGKRGFLRDLCEQRSLSNINRMTQHASNPRLYNYNSITLI